MRGGHQPVCALDTSACKKRKCGRQFGSVIKSEAVRYAKVIKDAGIKGE